MWMLHGESESGYSGDEESMSLCQKLAITRQECSISYFSEKANPVVKSHGVCGLWKYSKNNNVVKYY